MVVVYNDFTYKHLWNQQNYSTTDTEWFHGVCLYDLSQN